MVGTPMFKHGDTMYIINKDRLAQSEEVQPTETSALLEWYKKHADEVVHWEPAPIEIVDDVPVLSPMAEHEY
jgi:hypothetical protein